MDIQLFEQKNISNMWEGTGMGTLIEREIVIAQTMGATHTAIRKGKIAEIEGMKCCVGGCTNEPIYVSYLTNLYGKLCYCSSHKPKENAY